MFSSENLELEQQLLFISPIQHKNACVLYQGWERGNRVANCCKNKESCGTECEMYISMDRFISIVDLVPFIMEEKACIQILFDKGLLNTRMVCTKCYARLSLKDYSTKKYPVFVCWRGHKKILLQMADNPCAHEQHKSLSNHFDIG